MAVFRKARNVRCGIGSIVMSITSHIHNAVNHAIAKNSCQSYFKKFESLFSRKPQGAISTDWKISSYIFYHLCIVVTIFPSGYTTFDNFNNTVFFGTIQKTIILHSPVLIETSYHRFWQPHQTLKRAYYVSHVFFISVVCLIHLL